MGGDLSRGMVLEEKGREGARKGDKEEALQQLSAGDRLKSSGPENSFSATWTLGSREAAVAKKRWRSVHRAGEGEAERRRRLETMGPHRPPGTPKSLPEVPKGSGAKG